MSEAGNVYQFPLLPSPNLTPYLLLFSLLNIFSFPLPKYLKYRYPSHIYRLSDRAMCNILVIFWFTWLYIEYAELAQLF